MIKPAVKFFTLFWLLLLLISCGGGGSVERTDNGNNGGTGGNGGNGGGTTDQPTLALTITLPDGSAAGDLTATSPLQVNALLTDGNGAPMVGELVSFSVSVDNLAVLEGNGSAVTGDDGIAVIGLTASTESGSGLVTGTVTLNSGEVSDSAAFTAVGSIVEPDTLTLSLSISNSDGSAGDVVGPNQALLL